MKNALLIAVFASLVACAPAVERSADGRILLTPDTRADLQTRLLASQCDMSLLGGEPSFAEPVTTVRFPGSAQFPFTADLPYNPSWGTPMYASQPYEEFLMKPGSWIGFGPFSVGEGCGAGYTWNISSEGARTQDDVIRAINAGNTAMYPEGGLPPYARPVTMKINGMDAVRHVEEGFCTSPAIYLFAPGQTYHLSMTCGGDGESQEQLEMLGTIAESMVFSGR